MKCRRIGLTMKLNKPQNFKPKAKKPNPQVEAQKKSAKKPLPAKQKKIKVKTAEPTNSAMADAFAKLKGN